MAGPPKDQGGFGFKIEYSTTLDLKGAGKRVNDAIAKVVDRTARDVYMKIKLATPSRTGFARGSWKRYKSSDGLTAVIENKADYINVLEFGGYPVTALGRSGKLRSGALIRGKAQLGGSPPGPNTRKAQGGEPTMRSNVSKQAPRGMARRTMAEAEPVFMFDVAEAIDLAMAGPGEVKTFESTETLKEW